MSADLQCDALTVIGQCPDSAVMKVQGGCRHEHVRTRDLCRWHGEDMLSETSHGVCGACYDLGHDCLVLARLVAA